jgi:hypothetical protein
MNYGSYSNYYSRPRSNVNGVLTQVVESYKVSGISYFDQQFGKLWLELFYDALR